MLGKIGSMKHKLLVAGACATLAFAGGCEKKKTDGGTGGGGGGGGGAWLVGQDGLMANITAEGQLGEGYDLDSDHDLLSIVCRGLDTAFVAGELGTFLRTFDGGESWDVVDLQTTRTLRAVATAGREAVYVGGDGILARSIDDGGTWTMLPVDPAASWLSVAAGHGERALALDATGKVIAYDSTLRTIGQAATLEGATVVAMSHDGSRAAVAGTGSKILRSDDAGRTWRTIDLGQQLTLRDIWVTGAGDTVAVGDSGAIVRIAATGAVSIGTLGTANLRTVHINAEGRGFAAGDAGAVLSTSDGGITWSKLELGLTANLYAVDEVAGDGHL